MGKIWVVADHHFGHENIIRYARRPWDDANKMDGALVKLHNEVVAPEDTVYFLGDVTLKDAEKLGWLRRIINKMNGTKILIFGNHDRWHWERYLDAGFQSCHTYLEIEWKTILQMRPLDGAGHDTVTTKKVHLCHDPALAQDNTKLWVCGHVHNNDFGPQSHIAIVSVELTEYKPVLLEDIIDGYRPGAGVPRYTDREGRHGKDDGNGKGSNSDGGSSSSGNVVGQQPQGNPSGGDRSCL